MSFPPKKTFGEALNHSVSHDLELFRILWREVGGFRGVFASLYTLLAIGFWLISIPWWLTCDWWGTAISILSILLGLSPAGIAMLLGMLGADLKQMLIKPSKVEPNKTPLLGLIGGTLHYIFITIIALLLALLGSGWSAVISRWSKSELQIDSDLMWPIKVIGNSYSAISYFVFSLALFSAVHLVLLIFQMARFSVMAERSKELMKDNSPNKD